MSQVGGKKEESVLTNGNSVPNVEVVDGLGRHAAFQVHNATR